jgi:hypothetical protein
MYRHNSTCDRGIAVLYCLKCKRVKVTHFDPLRIMKIIQMYVNSVLKLIPQKRDDPSLTYSLRMKIVSTFLESAKTLLMVRRKACVTDRI